MHLAFFVRRRAAFPEKNVFSTQKRFSTGKRAGRFVGERIFSGNIGAVLILFMGGKGGVSGYNFPPRRI